MIEALRQQLETEYRYAVEAQADDDAEAVSAREAGDMPTYFDLALHMQLADVCWSLEKWDEAKHWYRHNARVMKERRRWRAEHLSPESQSEGISDWEASTFIKAGDLQAGHEYLKRAIAYWRDQPNSELRLTAMGLHAAQAGLPELATYAASVISARQELPGGNGEAAGQARKLLHYETAEVHLLLGRWDGLLAEMKALKEGQRLAEGNPNLIFPEPLQTALLAASRGLQILVALHGKEVAQDQGRQTAKHAFEEAMLNFYKFSGQVAWDLYFMRLNSRLVDDLADGRTPDVNPFANM